MEGATKAPQGQTQKWTVLENSWHIVPHFLILWIGLRFEGEEKSTKEHKLQWSWLPWRLWGCSHISEKLNCDRFRNKLHCGWLGIPIRGMTSLSHSTCRVYFPILGWPCHEDLKEGLTLKIRALREEEVIQAFYNWSHSGISLWQFLRLPFFSSGALQVGISYKRRTSETLRAGRVRSYS